MRSGLALQNARQSIATLEHAAQPMTMFRNACPATLAQPLTMSRRGRPVTRAGATHAVRNGTSPATLAAGRQVILPMREDRLGVPRLARQARANLRPERGHRRLRTSYCVLRARTGPPPARQSPRPRPKGDVVGALDVPINGRELVLLCFPRTSKPDAQSWRTSRPLKWHSSTRLPLGCSKSTTHLCA